MIRRILFGIIIVSVLFALPAGSMAFIENGDGKTEVYAVEITYADGVSFPDCYTFFPDGSLEISTLGAGVWAYDKNGKSKFHYQGIVSTWGVHGFKSKFLGLHGNEIESSGVTTVVKGKRVKECELPETLTNPRDR